MDLQLQLKRAIIAFAVWAVLGGVALSRAGTAQPAAGAPAPTPVHVSATSDHACRSRLRIDVTGALRLTVPCDRSCGTLRGVAGVLRMPVLTLGGECDAMRTT